MVEMFNLLKVEFHKFKTYKIFYFLIILTILQAASMITLSDSFKAEYGLKVLIRTFNTQEGLSIIIFAGIFIGDYIAKEFTSGYIKNLIVCGHKRFHIVISKAIVSCLGVVIIGFICPVVMSIRNTIVNGYGTQFNLENFMFLIRLFILMFFVYSALAVVIVFIAFLFRNSVGVVIAMSLGLDFMNRLFNIVAMRKGIILKIYNKSISKQVFQVTKHNILLSELMNITLFCLVLIAIFISLSIYIFKRADIK